jgi:dGTPase
VVDKLHYLAADRERFVTEQHSSGRGDFQRDRGRLIHSLALRRLAQKTQVLSPAAGLDFARNRLTHSLEVAQVGRELGQAIGLDPDVVDTACLAHDLGHPPFGHNGETALNLWAEDIGGFEGNAQTFRVLTRLESKTFDPSGRSSGVNLTRASLDAATKYPWLRTDAPAVSGGRTKFGVYADDVEIFDWMRDGHTHAVVSVEAQVMDLSDDIAYSVHDFEDAIVGGFLDPEELTDPVRLEDFLDHTVNWSGQAVSKDSVADALERLQKLPTWPARCDGSREDLARLKNFTSTAIGRFAQAVSLVPRHTIEPASPRHHWDVSVPEPLRVEIDLLKGIVATAVMSHEARVPLYEKQRTQLIELLDALWARRGDGLDPLFRGDWEVAQTAEEKRRVIVDQVASLTDQTALWWHERYVRS